MYRPPDMSKLHWPATPHQKDSLIFAVPISVQLLHSLSICSSYPLLAPQPRRDWKSSHHHCNHHHPKNEHRRAGSKKIKTKTKNRERLFLACPYNGGQWAGQATDPSSDQQTANQSPPPSHAWLLACSTAATYWHSSREFPHLALLSRATLFCFLGGHTRHQGGHSFASGQKASSYGMGTLPRFSFAFFVKKTGNKRAAGVGSLPLGEDQEEKTDPAQPFSFFLALPWMRKLQLFLVLGHRAIRYARGWCIDNDWALAMA